MTQPIEKLLITNYVQCSFSTAQGYLATEVSQLWGYSFGKWLRHECQICRSVHVLKYLGIQIYLESLSNLPNSYMQVQHQLYIARARVKIELLSKWSGRPLY